MGRLAVVKFLSQMNPAADVLALANLEVDISSIAPGAAIVVKWRGKPVFIRNRTGATVPCHAIRTPQQLTLSRLGSAHCPPPPTNLRCANACRLSLSCRRGRDCGGE